MAIDAAAEKQPCSCCLLSVLISESYLCHLSLRVRRPITHFGVRMKRNEEALVILTINTDSICFCYRCSWVKWLLQWPFLSPFLSFYSSLFPSFLPHPAPTLYSPNTGALYQLGGPRCAPQSSIEGLEDIEVGSLRTASQYIHQQPKKHRSTRLFVLPCSPTAFTKCCLYSFHVFESLFLSVSFSTLREPFCRGNVRRMCCCWWCTGETSWTQQAETQAQRLAMWPPWLQCWRRWRGCISRPPPNTWWSSWCRVRPCALKPSPWCPSECCCQNRVSH